MNWFMRNVSFSFVILLIFKSGKCFNIENGENANWWEATLVYQLSLSFYEDSNGDGIGDVKGLIDHLDYISSLGIETICLHPIYPSPFMDFGYDVSDYKNINPMYGNLSDFDDLVSTAHGHDMKIIMDFVPNHTSEEHEWFKASINMTEPYADYYIWANGTITEDGAVAPPDNSTNIMGNSTWTYNEIRDEWYYHKFDETVPDLNLENPNVLNELTSVLEFWLDRGVDGFRFIIISDTYDNSTLPNEQPPWRQKNLFDLAKNLQLLYDFRTFVSGWTLLNNSTSKYLVSEAVDSEQNLRAYYDTGVIPLNNCLIKSTAITGTNASKLETEITTWLNGIPLGASTNWMLTDTEMQRITSRVGSERLDAVLMLSMLLPGQAFMFYGDEVGMPSLLLNKTEQELMFNPSESNMTKAALLNNESSVNIDAETLTDIQKHLFVYQQLGQLRKKPVFRQGNWDIRTTNDDGVFVLRRTLPQHPIYVLVMNMAESEQKIDMAKLYEDLSEYLQIVVISGANDTDQSVVSQNDIILQPHVGAVLKSEGIDEWQGVTFGNDREEAYEENSNEKEEINRTGEIDKMDHTTSRADEKTEEAVKEIHDNSDGNNNFTSEKSSSETTITPEVKKIELTNSVNAGIDVLLANQFFVIIMTVVNMIFSQGLVKFSMENTRIIV